MHEPAAVERNERRRLRRLGARKAPGKLYEPDSFESFSSCGREYSVEISSDFARLQTPLLMFVNGENLDEFVGEIMKGNNGGFIDKVSL